MPRGNHRSPVKIGQTFGHYKVLSQASTQNRRYRYICECICGRQRFVRGSFLVNGTSKSCGCQGKGFKPKNGIRKWSKEEIKLLEEQYPIKGAKIPELLRLRDESAIRVMAYWLNIKFQGIKFNPRAWDETEIEVLKRHYPDGGTAETIRLLPKRTKEAIKIKANSIGLRYNHRKLRRK